MELVTYYFQCVGRTVTYIKYVGYENFDITSKQLVLWRFSNRKPPVFRRNRNHSFLAPTHHVHCDVCLYP